MGGGFEPPVPFVSAEEIREYNERMNNYDRNDTLKGYDIVLSISTEALNAQFQHLWRKQLKRALPDPRGGAFPFLTNFIAHDLWLFPPDLPTDDGAVFIDQGNSESQTLTAPQSTYLKAHVGPPIIEFHATKQRVATISVEFFQDEDADDGDKDSVLQYWAEGRPKRLIINDWKMSWEVEVMQEVIDDPHKHLIQPALNPTKHIVMEDRAIAEIQKHMMVHKHYMTTSTSTSTTDMHMETGIPKVDPSYFTVASIFCIITSSPEIPGSFKFTPPDGTKLVDSWARNAALTAIGAEFHRNLTAFDPRLPTPQSPFVLGYSVTQKVPSLSDLNSSLDDPSRTPIYFVPEQCHLSTTVVPGDEYTRGTLNFCMLTGDPSPYAAFRSDSQKDIDPNTIDHFDTTFFHDLFLYGGPKDRKSKSPGGHDGIMALSKKVFYYNWMQDSLLLKLLLQPEKYCDFLSNPGGQKVFTNKKLTTRTQTGEDNQNARWNTEFKLGDIFLPFNEGKGDFGGFRFNGIGNLNSHTLGIGMFDSIEPKGGLKQKGNGSQIISVTYSSDFQKYNLDQGERTDLKRQVYIDVEIETDLYVGVGVDLHRENEKQTSLWLHQFWLRSKYKLGYTITPGRGGIWSIQKDLARTNLPPRNASLDYVGTTKDGIAPERWQNWDETGCQLCSETSQEMFDTLQDSMLSSSWGDDLQRGRVRSCIERWFTAYAADLGNAGENLEASVANTVVLPMGNVVDFNSLDTNGGHVYTSVDFSTLTPELRAA